MRAKKILLAGVAAFLLVCLILAAQGPWTWADAKLVHGVHPIYWKAGAATIDRTYSLHTNYDDAVISLEKELGPQGWSHTDFFDRSMFTKGDRYIGESILVYRGRTVLGDDLAPTLGGPEAALQKKLATVPPHGWVTIKTRRHTGVITDMEAALRTHLRRLFHSPGVSYSMIMPRPKTGSPNNLVDVHKGTMTSESNDFGVSYFNEDP